MTGVQTCALPISSKEFWKVLSKINKPDKVTPFMHLFSLIVKSIGLDFIVINLIGVLLLFYSVLLAVASLLAILKLSTWYQEFLNTENKLMS